jgi:hypothetical protein
MFEKGRSGAYIPTGLLVRRQMEATSPWRFPPGNNLTKRVEFEPKSESDACPDCITELGIQKSEISQATVSAIRQKVNEQQQTIDAQAKNDITVRTATTQVGISAVEQSQKVMTTSTGAATDSARPGMAAEASALEEVSEGSEPGDLITAADLGAGLDAVILERGGRLERVIMNIRQGAPTAEAMTRLSKELILVSNAISSANVLQGHAQIDGTSPVNNDRAMVVDTAHGRQHSVPDLLSRIDEAAGGLNLGFARAREYHRSRSSTSITAMDDGHENERSPIIPDMIRTSSPTPLLSPGSRIANRQRLDQDFAAVRSHIAPFATSEGQPSARPRPADRTVHWPLSSVTSPEGIPVLHIDSPPPLKHNDSDLLRIAEANLPIKITIDQSTPTLRPVSNPSGPAPPSVPATPLLSPALFTASTCTSTPELTPSVQKPDTPFPLPASTAPLLPAPSLAAGKWPTSPSQARADTQVIRAAMRMERNKAVQEAAATERAVRKQRQVSAQARKALG